MKYGATMFINDRLVPKRWHRYAIVMAIVGLHFLLVVWVSWKFLSGGSIDVLNEDESPTSHEGRRQAHS